MTLLGGRGLGHWIFLSGYGFIVSHGCLDIRRKICGILAVQDEWNSGVGAAGAVHHEIKALFFSDFLGGSGNAIERGPHGGDHFFVNGFLLFTFEVLKVLLEGLRFLALDFVVAGKLAIGGFVKVLRFVSKLSLERLEFCDDSAELVSTLIFHDGLALVFYLLLQCDGGGQRRVNFFYLYQSNARCGSRRLHAEEKQGDECLEGAHYSA